MILYYCRFATRPVLLQLYQTEVGTGLSPSLARDKGGGCAYAAGQELPVKPWACGAAEAELGPLSSPGCPWCPG